SVNFSGAVRMVNNSDTATGNSFFDFTEEGASFNASFGGFFADIDKVNTVIASGVDGFFNLRSSAGLTLAATDNLDGTFTVAAIPEPSSALLLGLAGMSLILRRRRR
ncbi:MAG: PEP-CTERM sorting domain-containing protein, partial [Opitutales bacterium]